MKSPDLDAKLAELETMSLDELRRTWVRQVKTSPPKVSAGLFRLALAHWLQSKATGRVSKAMDRKLKDLAMGTAAEIGPGTRLVRSWNGRIYVVEVTDGGLFRWQDRDWNSLSGIARTITGARWSGPAFFGLRKKLA
jgi:hypothetical protein